MLCTDVYIFPAQACPLSPPAHAFPMPTICSFYGIVIRMYFAPGEHGPPHFHAYYNEFRATVGIRNPEILDGLLPPKQRKLIFEWAELRQAELLANWDLVMSGIHPKPLAPLK
jgi:hypothetical protein